MVHRKGRNRTVSTAHDFLHPHMPAHIAGKVYCIEDCNAEEGLRLHLLFATPDAMRWTDDELVEHIQKILGPAWDQMLADGVLWHELLHVGRTALIWYGQSPRAAELYWEAFDADPTPPTPTTDEPTPVEEWPEDGEPPGTRGPDDPGGGPYDEATGLRDWFYPPNYGKETPSAPRETLTWAMILDNWELVELDIQQYFGVDLESGILRERSFRWLNARVWGVLTEEKSRLRRRFGAILSGK